MSGLARQGGAVDRGIAGRFSRQTVGEAAAHFAARRRWGQRGDRCVRDAVRQAEDRGACARRH